MIDLSSVPWYDIGVALGGLVAGGFLTFWAKWRKNSKTKSLDPVNTSYLRLHSQINETLTELRVGLDSARTMLVQFHNGGMTANGASIFRFSITHESCALGVSPSLHVTQGFILSNYSDKLELLKIKPGKVIRTKELKESSFRGYLEAKNVLAFVLMPIYGGKQQNVVCQGYIACEWCSWSKVEAIDRGKAEDSIQEAARKIAEMLNFEEVANKR